MTYGEKIAELRRKKGMTQAELGNALSVTFQAVSKWENGLSEPDLDTIKKICEIFEISVSEFFDTDEKPAEEKLAEAVTVTTEKPKTVTESRPILGYCEDCHKPLYNPSEYVVKHYGRGGYRQHTYCNKCNQKRQEAQKLAEKEENVKKRKAGFIWGAVGGVILSVALIIYGVKTNNNLVAILGGILGIYGGFAFGCQMSWGNSVLDCFCFFIKTFHLPGIIFTLDLSGIIFLILVKVIGGILCSILSFLVFVFGLVITIGYSMISFPIAVVRQIKGEYD